MLKIRSLIATTWAGALAAALTCVLTGTPAKAATIQVDSTSESGPNVNDTSGGNGTDCTPLSSYSPNQAGICTLREAVAAALCDQAVNGCAPGDAGVTDTIVLEPATYSFSSPIDADPNLGDDGQGPNALSVLEGDGPTPLVIEGNGAVLKRTGSTPFRFIHAGAVLTIRNLTFEGGASCVSDVSCKGAGAILLDRGIYTLENLSFLDNTALLPSGDEGAPGGAIGIGLVDFDEATPGPFAIVTISDSVFSGNTAAGGGALVSVFGELSVSSSTFRDNQDAVGFIGDSGATGGGAIAVLGGHLSVTRSSFYRNASAFSGGAILLANLDSVDVTELFDQEGFVTPYGVGGTHEISRTTFSQNEAPLGGAIFVTGTLLGGGDDGDKEQPPPPEAGLTLAESLDCDASVNGVTFSENVASNTGGAIYELSATTCLKNSILSGNSDERPDDGVGAECRGTLVSQGNNVFSPQTKDGACIVEVFDAANQGADLVGDAALEAFDESDAGAGRQGYELKDSSPACGSADPETALTHDQKLRVWDGAPDIGAFESCSGVGPEGGTGGGTCGDGECGDEEDATNCSGDCLLDTESAGFSCAPVYAYTKENFTGDEESFEARMAVDAKFGNGVFVRCNRALGGCSLVR